MDIEYFRKRASEVIRQNPAALLEPVPAGSGIYRFVNVPIERYDPGFIPTRQGRWNEHQADVGYYANDVKTCAAEVGYYGDQAPIPADYVVELLETTAEKPAFNVYRLPQDIQHALFELKEQDGKWDKPHALMEIIRNVPEYRGVDLILSPSASGLSLNIGGTCFIAQGSGSVKLVRSLPYRDYVNL